MGKSKAPQPPKEPAAPASPTTVDMVAPAVTNAAVSRVKKRGQQGTLLSQNAPIQSTGTRTLLGG